MFRFYLQWSKVVQYTANSNEGNQKLEHIQNYDKKYGKTFERLVSPIVSKKLKADKKGTLICSMADFPIGRSKIT